MTKRIKATFVGLLFVNFLALLGYSLVLAVSGKGDLIHYSNLAIVIWYMSAVVMFIISHFTGCWED